MTSKPTQIVRPSPVDRKIPYQVQRAPINSPGTSGHNPFVRISDTSRPRPYYELRALKRPRECIDFEEYSTWPPFEKTPIRMFQLMNVIEKFEKSLNSCTEVFSKSTVLSTCKPAHKEGFNVNFTTDATELLNSLSNIKNKMEEPKSSENQEPMSFDFTQFVIWKSFLSRLFDKGQSRFVGELPAVIDLLLSTTELVNTFRTCYLKQIEFSELIGIECAENVVYKEVLKKGMDDIRQSQRHVTAQTKTLKGYMAYNLEKVKTFDEQLQKSMQKYSDEIFYYLTPSVYTKVLRKYEEKKNSYQQIGRRNITLEWEKRKKSENYTHREVVFNRESEEDVLPTIQQLQSLSLPPALRVLNRFPSSEDGDDNMEGETNTVSNIAPESVCRVEETPSGTEVAAPSLPPSHNVPTPDASEKPEEKNIESTASARKSPYSDLSDNDDESETVCNTHSGSIGDMNTTSIPSSSTEVVQSIQNTSNVPQTAQISEKQSVIAEKLLETLDSDQEPPPKSPEDLKNEEDSIPSEKTEQLKDDDQTRTEDVPNTFSPLSSSSEGSSSDDSDFLGEEKTRKYEAILKRGHDLYKEIVLNEMQQVPMEITEESSTPPTTATSTTSQFLDAGRDVATSSQTSIEQPNVIQKETSADLKNQNTLEDVCDPPKPVNIENIEQKVQKTIESSPQADDVEMETEQLEPTEKSSDNVMEIIRSESTSTDSHPIEFTHQQDVSPEVVPQQLTAPSPPRISRMSSPGTYLSSFHPDNEDDNSLSFGGYNDIPAERNESESIPETPKTTTDSESTTAQNISENEDVEKPSDALPISESH